MKIAIQGHPTRGKEVIQILESLGGKNGYDQAGGNKNFVYFINNIGCIYSVTPQMCSNERKIYTLEEFEKEFPFKVGDKVIHKEFNDFFEVISFNPGSSYPYKIKGVCEFNTKSHVLTKWQPKMKEERFVTLTLDKAKEWYKKGGELKEIALQAFTEKELNPPLPKNWEEYCKHTSTLTTSFSSCPRYDAFVKLEHLRDCWLDGWKPKWDISEKWCIRLYKNELHVGLCTDISRFLTFPTREMAYEFLKCFRYLIEQARDLI